jgi:hypothetical protein
MTRELIDKSKCIILYTMSCFRLLPILLLLAHAESKSCMQTMNIELSPLSRHLQAIDCALPSNLHSSGLSFQTQAPSLEPVSLRCPRNHTTFLLSQNVLTDGLLSTVVPLGPCKRTGRVFNITIARELLEGRGIL